MNDVLSSIPTHRISRGLLFLFASIAAGTVLSACTGPEYRHDSRVDRRGDRQDYRTDRRYDRADRRYERWN
ncbi:MAG TPA: hypothetical protein VFG14_07200 [Chthoniobacteraceae bacterium]|nr:hypothetical protein [Chthoniobacteraceae bacterium]